MIGGKFNKMIARLEKVIGPVADYRIVVSRSAGSRWFTIKIGNRRKLRASCEGDDMDKVIGTAIATWQKNLKRTKRVA